MRLPGFQKFFLLCLAATLPTTGYGQPSDDAIAKIVTAYKKDSKGPYRDIRWFCKDGTTVGPQERCPEVGGVQRARYKDEVITLGNTAHLFLGQILSTTPNEDFWDQANSQSRLKQYQLEQYLKAIDNGWVNRKAQFYRGAFQVEDEEAWGIQFLEWVLSDDNRITQQFFLIRQSAKDIPHAGDNNVAQSVRALSLQISDQYSPFMDLRVKLHGQPEQADIQKVKDFREKHKEKFSNEIDSSFVRLIGEMEVLYKPVDFEDYKAFVRKLPVETTAFNALDEFIENYTQATTPKERCWHIAQAALAIREEILNPMKPEARLALIDASIKMEGLIIRESPNWRPTTLRGQMLKVHHLAQAAAGFGYLEHWEWQQLSGKLALPNDEQITLEELSEYVDDSRRTVEWGAGMVRAAYQDVVKLYSGFEPLANGLIDDKVRASVLLQLGSSVSRLGDYFANKAGFSNKIMGIHDQSSIRGLNPGYAQGELVVTNQSTEELEISGDKIYVFNRPPSDLKPVAGIATVTEGNMVSHLQLLARNLGIPNAVLSMDNLNALLPHNGKKVFYAVSNKGTVVMKPANEMNDVEKALFTKKARSEEKIIVPVEVIELSNPTVLNLRDVNASQSGKVCGPKAANLGQLKQLFPDNVVEGLVIPFSIFRQHFDQQIPRQNQSYWEFLNGIFSEAETMRETGRTDSEIENYVLGQLDILRGAIAKIQLKPEFEAELKAKFKEVFGKEMGQVPVFLRSDTNMEDLKDFTGAGLNLTLFNVLEANRIMQGIKDVWASPYTERSYKWRQSYLLNPENVFPSILIIPSVNADYSGVLITKGVTTGSARDITIAFNKGVGGAVEGQASETWLLNSDRTSLLLSPAREPEFTSIPITGGTKKLSTTFEERLLSESDLKSLERMAGSINDKLPDAGLKGPYDVELGLKEGQIWLFQVRPFVENRRATASEYLRSITPELAGGTAIRLDSKL